MREIDVYTPFYERSWIGPQSKSRCVGPYRSGCLRLRHDPVFRAVRQPVHQAREQLAHRPRRAERQPGLLGAAALGPAAATALELEARADAAAVLAPFGEVRGFGRLIVVGGTAFTAAAMVAGGMRDGTRMTRAECGRLTGRLLERDL